MGPRDVGIVISGVLSGGGFGARHESEIMGFEENLCHFDGGSDNDREGPESEVHDGAVFSGELMNGLVGQRADQVEISDEGPWFGTRRQVELPATEPPGKEEEGHGCYPCRCIRNPRRKFHGWLLAASVRKTEKEMVENRLDSEGYK